MKSLTNRLYSLESELGLNFIKVMYTPSGLAGSKVCAVPLSFLGCGRQFVWYEWSKLSRAD